MTSVGAVENPDVDVSNDSKRSNADVKNDISGDIGRNVYMHRVQIHSPQMKLPTNKLGKLSEQL
jgi:hypothetical protein